MYTIRDLRSFVMHSDKLVNMVIKVSDEVIENDITRVNGERKITDFDYLHIGKGHTYEIPVPIPKFCDPRDFEDYFTRCTDKTTTLKTYAVKEPLRMFKNNIFLHPDVVTLIEGDSAAEQCWLDGDGVINKSTNKTYRISNHIVKPGDLYKNPGNRSIHHHGVLLESPHAYWGESLYYNPLRPEEIQIKVYGQWLWVSVEDFEVHLPEELKEEYALVKSLWK